ncbi:MAG: RNA methyltransferase [Saprospiraceae bacterium]|nr:RNA methyltransferase [Saprospiraceae bacterium]
MKKLSLLELDRPDVEQFKKSDKNQIIVVLDNVRSALNVGSFFRTCDGFAVETLFLTGITACPPNREIQKTAIGATESVSWEYRENIVDAVTEIKAAGYKVWGVEQTNQSVMLDSIEMEDQKIALVFGNEIDGLSEEILPILDGCIEIPQFGTKHSLNVAVCGGIVLWEMIRKRK